jgi:hypothetical protein
MPNGSTRPIPTPLPPDLVDLVRAHGWELAPAGWLRRQLDDRDRLRQQLERARAGAATPGPENGTRDSATANESHTPRESID